MGDNKTSGENIAPGDSNANSNDIAMDDYVALGGSITRGSRIVE